MEDVWELSAEGCYVALTHDSLDAKAMMDKVRSPAAGAIVVFAGTTRDNFAGKPVKELKYSAYHKLALQTMMTIAKAVTAKHSLKGFAMVHRLGVVGIGEESILIAVSSPHRQAAWKAGEEALEECKSRVEIWKLEEFHDEEEFGGRTAMASWASEWRSPEPARLQVAPSAGIQQRKTKHTHEQATETQRSGCPPVSCYSLRGDGDVVSSCRDRTTHHVQTRRHPAGAGRSERRHPLKAAKNHVHATWARTFSSVPELYFQPETVEQVQKLLRLAHQARRRVVVTGSGHSPSHLTCTSHWLVNLDKLCAILETDSATHRVTVEAGIRLRDLGDELEKRGLDMQNLGSINEQSVAGVISTGTHGSSLRHGLVVLPAANDELFRAGLISLGALGIIVEVTYQAIPSFSLRWSQSIDTDQKLFASWSREWWAQKEFIRVWWLPHTRRAVTWSADRTEEPTREPRVSYYDGALGYHIYHNLLYVGHFFPRILPWVEWFVFGMQYGFKNGTSSSAVQPSRKALLLNCLYSHSWLNHLAPDHPDYWEPNIPFSARGIYIHAPLEVRVTNSVPATPEALAARPLLDSSMSDGPTLYLNATLYRPYHTNPSVMHRYYEAFEWLMRDLGGRPHWAKNFLSDTAAIETMYGDNLTRWRKVRDEVDPEGLFVGPWHREKVLRGPVLPLEERRGDTTETKDRTGATRVVFSVPE
ncbi:unnamed protein product [Parascedosporium putredinis]|uniref:D-arabinono-1,4-lactone oxidase n=1 Tax=Parascedosporium putredinis TaxID=1442378 RepID=A0A9P1GV73_9PEZI|nr:unnamed protein product [Parascedosporium putredinis]CAI7988264.1 unnamed protein product [Parascedosporium putredinis]